MADVQKLNYLKSRVTNSASDMIKSFPTTGDNYQELMVPYLYSLAERIREVNTEQ